MCAKSCKLYYLYLLIPIAYIVVAIFMVQPLYSYACNDKIGDMRKIQDSIVPPVMNIMPVDSIGRRYLLNNDTLIYVSDFRARVAHVDSMYNDMYRLSERYREETALLVDRTGAWMGFWIALICLLTGLGALFQFFNNKAELKGLRTAIENERNTLRLAETGNKLSAVSHSIMSLADVSFTTDIDSINSFVKMHMKLLDSHFCHYVDLVASSKSEATEEDMHQTFVILSLLLDSMRKLPIVVAHPELDVNIKILEMNLAQSIKEISENSLDNNEFKKRMRELKTDFAKIARSV